MKKGFTLIELSIVLIVIGIIFSLGTVQLLKNLVKTNSSLNEKKAISSLSDGVIQFAISINSYTLPSNEEFLKIAKQNNYKYNFIYKRGLDDSICTSDATPLIVKINDVSVNNVAFVILSRGVDTNLSTNTQSNPMVIENDDVVEFATLNELKIRANCENKKVRIVNKELPKIRTDGTYMNSFSIIAEGGKPNENKEYKWCVEMERPENLFGANKLKILENIQVSNKVSIECAPNRLAKKLTIDAAADDIDIIPGVYRLNFIAMDMNNEVDSKKLILTVRDIFDEEVDNSTESDCGYKLVAGKTLFLCKKKSNNHYCITDPVTLKMKGCNYCKLPSGEYVKIGSGIGVSQCVQ